METLKLLVVDDEADIRELLESYFSSQGHTVLTADNGADGFRQFEANSPDLIILDVAMPEMDGFSVLRQIRKQSTVPVIMLTARSTSMDTVQGLHTGADDYVHKPFDLAVLDARIKAIVRRLENETESAPIQLEIGSLVIDDGSKEVSRDGKSIHLTPKEYDLLRLLASAPGKVFSHDEIIDVVWDDGYLVGSMDVIKYVNLLRNKIEENSKEPKIVLTVRGFGYKLVDPDDYKE